MVKILLVEDNKSLREIYGVRLLAEGYDIVSAGDGEEALAVAIKERPDLILSDVMMPKVSGFDMLDILRSTTKTKNIKIIIMTALSSEEQRQRGESLGADLYLVKSQVGIEDVVRAVKEILSNTPVTVAHDSQQSATRPQPIFQPASVEQSSARQQVQFGAQVEGQLNSDNYLQSTPLPQSMPKPIPAKSINKLGSSLERVIQPNPEAFRDNFDAETAIADALKEPFAASTTVQPQPEPEIPQPQTVPAPGQQPYQPTRPTPITPAERPAAQPSVTQQTQPMQATQNKQMQRPPLVVPLQQQPQSASQPVAQPQMTQPQVLQQPQQMTQMPQPQQMAQMPSQPVAQQSQPTAMSNYRPIDNAPAQAPTQFPPQSQPPVL